MPAGVQGLTQRCHVDFAISRLRYVRGQQCSQEPARNCPRWGRVRSRSALFRLAPLDRPPGAYVEEEIGLHD